MKQVFFVILDHPGDNPLDETDLTDIIHDGSLEFGHLTGYTAIVEHVWGSPQ